MKINLIYDFPIYSMSINLVEQELLRRGHEVVITRERFRPDLSCDCSLAIMGNPLTKGSRPRFFMEHGVSITKRQLYDLPIDCFIAFSDSWASYVKREMDEVYGYHYDIRIAGYPKADEILKRKGKTCEICYDIHKDFKLDDRKKLVTYFPTYRQADGRWNEFRSIFTRSVKMEEVYNVLKDNFYIFVAPHYLESWERNMNIPVERILPFDADVRLNFLVSSDCIITDTSGMAYEASVADVPIVLLGREDMGKSYFVVRMNEKDPYKEELEYLDIGPVADLSNLVSCIGSADTTYYSDRRSYWAKKACGVLDGHATERVVDVIENYMKEVRK